MPNSGIMKPEFMKANLLLIALLFIGTASFSQTYYVYTAKSSGIWNNAANWTIALRTDGKTKNKVVIPKSVTIVADNNVNYMGLGDVEIAVAGKISMMPSTTLTLGANSIIDLQGGDISGNSSTQKILIGSVVKYDGSKDFEKRGYSYADATTGISPNGFYTPVILPVHFVSFNAMRVEKSNVALTWVTSDEVDNKHFNVQKSEDGTNWKQIAAVFPQTGTSTLKTYNYTDKNAVSNIQYYRIAQVDMDGKMTYSAVRTVNNNAVASSTKAYSAGSNNIVIESAAAGNGHAKVSVIALNGQVVTTTVVKEQSRIVFNTNKSLNGVYILRIDHSDGTSGSQKLVL